MEVFGKPIIDKYRKGDLDTAAFCDQYFDLHAYDEDADRALEEDDFTNELFDLCVRYQDAVVNKVAIENGQIGSKTEIANEISDLILEIEENSQPIKG